jgi:hypothetical protein
VLSIFSKGIKDDAAALEAEAQVGRLVYEHVKGQRV